MTEPFHISYDDCVRMTYRQAWDRHIEPAIEKRKEFDRDTGHVPASNESTHRSGRSTGAFDVTKATAEEANSMFDRLCGDKVYDGPKWWIPGEVPGIKTYDGKG